MSGLVPHSRNEITVALVCLVGYLPQLGFEMELDGWIYFVVAREMAFNGHWLIPRYTGDADVVAGTVFLEKPPLVFWLQGLSMDAVGATWLGARLPSVLATAACAVVVVRIGTELYSDRTGLVSGLAFLTLPAVFQYGNGGRTATTDIFLLLFGTLFVWFAFRSPEEPRHLLPAGVAGGLAVMSKQVAAGVYLLVAAPFLLRAARRHAGSFRRGVAAGALVVLPWNVYALARYPETYLRQMVYEQFVGRLGTGSEPLHGQVYEPVGPFNPFYLLRFPGYVGPFLLPLAVGAYYALRDAREGTQRAGAGRVLCWWLVAPILLFTVLTSSTWIHYVMASVVPTAVLSGYGVTRTLRVVRNPVSWTPSTRARTVGWALLALVALAAYPAHRNGL